VLTHYTAPVFVAFLAPFILKEKLTLRILTVVCIASAGLWIMLDGFSIDEHQIMGIAAGLASGFAYAVIVIFLRLHAEKFTPLVLAFFSNITVLILLAPFVRQFPMHALWIYLFMGVVHSTIAPILYYKGLQEVTANKAAVLGYLEPVCAIIISMIFLNELPGVNAIIGGTLIIFSGYLTLRGKK
jgi:drug/metabolite transporter (DMT)-like permease